MSDPRAKRWDTLHVQADRVPSMMDFLEYEIHSSVWASLISWSAAQSVTGRYFAWRVNRKYARYKHSLKMKRLVGVILTSDADVEAQENGEYL